MANYQVLLLLLGTLAPIISATNPPPMLTCTDMGTQRTHSELPFGVPPFVIKAFINKAKGNQNIHVMVLPQVGAKVKKFKSYMIQVRDANDNSLIDGSFLALDGMAITCGDDNLNMNTWTNKPKDRPKKRLEGIYVPPKDVTSIIVTATIIDRKDTVWEGLQSESIELAKPEKPQMPPPINIPPPPPPPPFFLNPPSIFSIPASYYSNPTSYYPNPAPYNSHPAPYQSKPVPYYPKADVYSPSLYSILQHIFNNGVQSLSSTVSNIPGIVTSNLDFSKLIEAKPDEAEDEIIDLDKIENIAINLGKEVAELLQFTSKSDLEVVDDDEATDDGKVGAPIAKADLESKVETVEETPKSDDDKLDEPSKKADLEPEVETEGQVKSTFKIISTNDNKS
ncbi:DOMON domain-containing protein frrs1L [Blomia tropicalis]|nr:DOMON domain-containing protein frrs1L [Blomia tropicalis]